MSKLTRNERTKLTATFVNGLAVAVFAVGGLTQAVKVTDPAAQVGLASLIVSVSCFLGSFALHMIARWILRRLEE